MAHLAKYTQQDYPKLLRHYERAKDGKGNYHKFKNQDIDITRTSANYNLADFQTLPQAAFMKKRLGQLKIFNRGDVKYLCDWVVTLPKIMGNDEQKFFAETFEYLTRKYGRQNVVSAYVHKDETQPHMHFAFIPVAMDKKKNIEKLCSKNVIGRNDLKAFHEEFDRHMASVFGYDTGIRNNATKDGNKSIEELKRGTAVKALGEKKAELKAIENRIDKLQWPDRIKPIKEKGDNVVIPKADLQSVNDVLSKRALLESKAGDADKILRTDYRMDNFRLQNKVGKLKAEKAAIVTERDKLQNKLNRFYSVFSYSPNFFEEFLRLLKEMEHAQTEAECAARLEKHLQRQLERSETEM